MENFKFLMLWVAFSILLTEIRAESLVEEALSVPADSDSNLKLEIKKLKSKISSLESSLMDKTKELKIKDENIAVLDTFLQEKTIGTGELQSEAESLKKKGVAIAKEAAGEVHARADELEKEIVKLKAEINTLTRNNQLSEARTGEAEKKVVGLERQLRSLEKTNDDQKHRLKKTKHALQVAEEELMRTQLEATSKSKVLEEIHGAWLPLWLANHISPLQEISLTEWNEHGKPILDLILQISSEKSAKAKKWAEPHLESVQTKWIPAAKERWTTLKTSIRPHVQTLSSKSAETYEYCITKVTPHIVKVHKSTTPYIQEIRKLSKPHIDQITTISKPHVEKVRNVLKPYTNHVVYVSGKFLESATTYHHQIQGAIQEKLEKHELTARATKEFIWFAASALLALPIIFVYKVLRFLFGKKSRKPSETHTSHGRNGNRKHRKRHTDK